MEKKRKIAIGHAIFLLLSVLLIVLLIIFSPKEKKTADDTPEVQEEVFVNPPVLTDLKVENEEFVFSSEVNKYEILIPMGNPIPPLVEASAEDGINIDTYQAFVTDDKTEFTAKVYLDDGKMQNCYEVKFIQDESKGFVLQYDDRIVFVPDYQLAEGENFVFSVEGEGNNLEVDEQGNVRVIGISDVPATVNAYVGETLVGSLTVDKTTKALLDIFIIAGQGNAAGEGGNAELSDRPDIGTAYTVELDDRNAEIKDLSVGRTGFAPAFAKEWYALTGEKSLYLQTAVSDVSVTMWTTEGEAYALASKRVKEFKEKLQSEDSCYIVNRIACIWLQGEWDIANKMSSEDYTTYFTEFYSNLKNELGVELTAIIPVRSSLEQENNDRLIVPVCAAQYNLANKYGDVIISTRLTESACIENGFVANDNLYYTQNGYNAIGTDSAKNVFGYFGAEDNGRTERIELYAKTHGGVIENGGSIEVKRGDLIQIISVTVPLYAMNSNVSVAVDTSCLKYSEGGLITVIGESFTSSEVVITSGGAAFKFNIVLAEEPVKDESNNRSYTWNFEDLSEAEGKNDLRVSKYSSAEGYVFSEGSIILKDRLADFSMKESIELNSSVDWCIEWNGKLSDNGIILGKDYSTSGFVYLAPYWDAANHPVRMVDDNKKTIHLYYGDSVEENKTMNTWSISYKVEMRTISLCLNGEVISSYTLQIDEDFKFTFSNLFGRFGSETVNYCLVGEVDYIIITVG